MLAKTWNPAVVEKTRRQLQADRTKMRQLEEKLKAQIEAGSAREKKELEAAMEAYQKKVNEVMQTDSFAEVQNQLEDAADTVNAQMQNIVMERNKQARLIDRDRKLSEEQRTLRLEQLDDLVRGVIMTDDEQKAFNGMKTLAQKMTSRGPTSMGRLMF